MAMEDRLQSLILERYSNPVANEICRCGDGYRIARCRWDGCFQYPTSCEKCFVESHKTNPLHWALIWDSKRELWIRKDYSELIGGTFIQIGHVGEDAPCPSSVGPVDFNITHTNGVHETKVRFCECSKYPIEHVDQLIRSDLFPATHNDPRSAFTLAALRHFRMHNLQSKCGAFDWIMSIRRLTNNTFTQDVPVSEARLFDSKPVANIHQDPYKAFLRIVRIWEVLSMKRWMGVCLGIKKLLPTRSLGALNVFCPSCPEPGVNMPLQVAPRPSHLRYVHLPSNSCPYEAHRRYQSYGFLTTHDRRQPPRKSLCQKHRL